MVIGRFFCFLLGFGNFSRGRPVPLQQGEISPTWISLQGGPPTSYKWSCNPYKWPYNWVTGVITLVIEVITQVITGRGPTLYYFRTWISLKQGDFRSKKATF